MASVWIKRKNTREGVQVSAVSAPREEKERGRTKRRRNVYQAGSWEGGRPNRTRTTSLPDCGIRRADS